MYTPQAGIFALGTSSHAYLEFDVLNAKKCKEFASTISAIREPRTTTGGVNFVIGFRGLSSGPLSFQTTLLAAWRALPGHSGHRRVRHAKHSTRCACSLRPLPAHAEVTSAPRFRPAKGTLTPRLIADISHDLRSIGGNARGLRLLNPEVLSASGSRPAIDIREMMGVAETSHDH